MTVAYWNSSTLVNQTTSGTQIFNGCAALNDGGYVIVWEDQGGPLPIVRFRVFNADGSSRGAENSIPNYQLHDFNDRPSVTATADGGFVISFTTRYNDGSPATDLDVYAHQYSASGLATGAYISVNNRPGDQYSSSVAKVGGNVVVAFQDDTVNGGDIAVSLLSGGLEVNSVLVNTRTTGVQTDPDVIALSSSRFLVTWSDENAHTVNARMYDVVGTSLIATTLTDNILGNTSGFTDAFEYHRQSVVALTNGNIAITWFDIGGLDGSGAAIIVAVYDSSFNLVGGPPSYIGNTTTSGDQKWPDIVALHTGGFAVVWGDESSGAYDVKIQIFNNAGQKVGLETLVNTGATAGHQNFPAVTELADGRIVVAWKDDNYSDGSAGAIRQIILDGRDGNVVGTNNSATLYGSDTLGDTIVSGLGYDTIYGLGGNDVVYTHVYDTAFSKVDGGLGFNTLVLTNANALVHVGSGYVTNIQQVILGGGTNTVDVSIDTGFKYIYGGGGGSSNSISTGGGGGYLISAGGSNHMYGGDGVNVYIGGIGTSDMHGGTGNNVYYVGLTDSVAGSGVYNTEILLAPNANLNIGTTQVQQVILNGGTNIANMTGSTDFIYLYGGSGTNTMTTGAGGGYELSTGGLNHMIGGGGPNVFVGGVGTSDMHGGTGVNTYYVGVNDTVAGAGIYNTLIELATDVSLTLGSPGMTGVQQVILNLGTNTVDASSAISQIFFYGNAGSDTLKGGAGSDYYYAGGGANTFVMNTNWGQDFIQDWAAGANNVIDFHGTAITNFGQITQTIVNGNDVITSNLTGGNSITLTGVSTAQVASHFTFA